MATDVLASSPCGHLAAIGRGRKAFVPDPLPRELDLTRKLVYELVLSQPNCWQDRDGEA